MQKNPKIFYSYCFQELKKGTHPPSDQEKNSSKVYSDMHFSVSIAKRIFNGVTKVSQK